MAQRSGDLERFHEVMKMFAVDNTRPNQKLGEQLFELSESFPAHSPENDIATDALVWTETEPDFPVPASRAEILKRYQALLEHDRN